MQLVVQGLFALCSKRKEEGLTDELKKVHIMQTYENSCDLMRDQVHIQTAPALLPTYAPFPFIMTKGEGDRVFDDKDQAYWDFYGGHCVASTGHGHPTVIAAVVQQAQDLMFYSTAGSLPVREQAAEALVAFANRVDIGIASAFFCNSGAEANESALKVAIKLTGRKRFVAFEGSFHGRTLLALSVTDDAKLRKGFEAHLAPVTFLPFGDLEALALTDLRDVAAVILEPIQSMAGVKTADAAWFHKLLETCGKAGTLLLFDEVQTGFGRLGAPFAANLLGIRPDLITCAKGIASGVPMGALLMSESIANQLKPGDLGSTFGGSPLACAALLATLQVIEEDGLMERALALEAKLRAGLAGSAVTEVHGEGLLLGLRIPGKAPALKAHLFSDHILVGGSADPDVLRLMPPLVLTDHAVEAFLASVHSFKEC